MSALCAASSSPTKRTVLSHMGPDLSTYSVSLVPSGGLPACFVIVPACLVITCYDLVVEATYRRVAHYRVSWPAACTPGEPALQNMALTLVFTLLEM